jgi:hypothetical protein
VRHVYSIELANKLRALLFTKCMRDHKARYDARSADLEALAELTWVVHGVCLKCRCWAITVGRCADCGIDYTPSDIVRGSLAHEEMCAVQIKAAYACT